MFTGIIEERGTITEIHRNTDAARITVHGSTTVAKTRRGDSISVSGVCLTVTAVTAEGFTADIMAQTLHTSTLGAVTPGQHVNLERAARVGDRLGGHIVQGHVDGTARVLTITPGSAWQVVRFTLDPTLAPLVVNKGSIAVDGVSLTVSTVSDPTVDPAAGYFDVSLIPETLTVTTLGALAVGDTVNIETDILARHAARILRYAQTGASA
ncbi:MAG: riboflavin synthase [Candidatus Lumbricidophila eiseniae]|uniref:Riboflavin synthase n=1 Tax=Candidatus Lumbricidiphila eiseniae TaxID=1969409 RepID=A0A2A6FS80_9MICO|nr:MAG: riboflavin synthase [Candidatus Lumbricidophila eiseniae]